MEAGAYTDEVVTGSYSFEILTYIQRGTHLPMPWFLYIGVVQLQTDVRDVKHTKLTLVLLFSILAMADECEFVSARRLGCLRLIAK